jgi:hypothetical protein
MITTLLDVQSLTVVILARRLKAGEEAFDEPPSSMQHEGKLYLMEESGMHAECGVTRRTRAQALDASLMSAVANVVMDAVVGAGAEAVGRKRMMSASDVGSWAIGPANAGPSRRSRPTWSMMKKSH